MYLKNDVTDQVCIFANYQKGWSPKTPDDPPVPQEDIDAYLLTQAKMLKVVEIKEKLQIFKEKGYLYPGEIICPAWVAETEYSLGAIVLASDSSNYESLVAGNIGNDPISSPNDWRVFQPVFQLTDDVVLNLDSALKLPVGTTDQYKFYDKSDSLGCRHLIDFGDMAGLTLFVGLFLSEQSRVMKKYNAYRLQVAECSTVEEVDAIIVDYST